MGLLAGVLALATIGCLPFSGGAAHSAEAGMQGHIGQITEVNIARIKNVLRLTPAQLPYWTPVEASLRAMAREQTQSDSDGVMKRISRRVITVALTATNARRLAAAASPLIRSLDDEQKRAAMMLAQEMGLGSVVAALN
jgi:hypothetical protein